MSKLDVVEALSLMHMDLINMATVNTSVMDDEDGLTPDDKRILGQIANQIARVLHRIQTEI